MSLKCDSEMIPDGKIKQTEPNKDPINRITGNFGRWQLKISILMALIKFPIAWFQMSIVFLAPPTTFWCEKPKEYQNMTDDEWRTFSKPLDKSKMQTGINRGFCYIEPSKLNFSNNTNLNQSCSAYNFDRNLFTSTITSEWNLVCDKERLTDLTQVTLMLGILLGNIIFGILADKLGRKQILLLCLLLQSIFGILASISPFFWLFVTLRFCLALANGGTMVTSFVICMEIVGGKWRTIVPILYQIPFGFGYAILSLFAYFIRDWRYFHLTISALSMLYVALFWFIPESPRWLMAIGKKKEALLILEDAAKENRINPLVVSEEIVKLSIEGLKRPVNDVKVRALFATRKLRKISCLLNVNWTISGITFFAFIQYVGHISENIFLTVAFGGLISLPGTIICVFLVKNYGRRLTIVYSFLLTAICCLLILAFPKGIYVSDWPRVALAGAGIIGLSISIPAMYLFTGELYPTVIRNSGVGFAMMFTRLGSMIAPLLVSLENIANYLPLLIISIATVVQALLVLPLSETQGKNLPETMADFDEKSCKYQEEALNLEECDSEENCKLNVAS